MAKVKGIGGVFFKAKDPKAMQAWYKRHLGIDVQDWGGAAFSWADADGKPTGGTTAWCIKCRSSCVRRRRRRRLICGTARLAAARKHQYRSLDPASPSSDIVAPLSGLI